MMDALSAWWTARTPREQRLISYASIFVLAVLAPLWALFSALSFREDAASRLASARAIEAQVASIIELSGGSPITTQGEDRSLRARALAAAQAGGLTPARVEAIGADRLRIAFQPADSLAVYRWIEAVGRSGAFVSRSTIQRVAEGDLVSTEFEVSSAP